MARFPRLPACQIIFIASTAVLALLIWTLWLGVNSDKDNIHPLLNQLIPAGHCACQTSTVFQCDSCLQCSARPPPVSSPTTTLAYNSYDSGFTKNHSLNETQCEALFPGLFQDPHRAQQYWTVRGGINRSHLDDVDMVDSMARVAIRGGRLYVIRSLCRGEDHRRKILGILSSIHRALVSAPDSAAIPDTEFIFTVEDKLEDIAGSGHPLWVLTRKATEESVWLMPDFGFWSWDNGNVDNMIGPFDEVVEHIRKNEISWDKKADKLVWRGKLSFAPKLRRTLLEAARDRPWGDVKEVEWKNRDNFLTMEDHCNYRFIAHVEGRSYSASLKYRQACQSVMVIHKLQYIQHHHYLLVPSGPHQNYVEVERDFSDLPSKMQDLLDHPDKARKIAENSVRVFRERYLTAAADTCYWRALLQAWAAASPGITSSRLSKGLRFEAFALLPSSEMLHFAMKQP